MADIEMGHKGAAVQYPPPQPGQEQQQQQQQQVQAEGVAGPKAPPSQQWWHTAFSLLGVVILLFSGILAFSTRAIVLTSDTVPAFVGSIGWQGASFEFKPANMNIQAGPSQWAGVHPNLGNMWSAFQFSLGVFFIALIIMIGLIIFQILRLAGKVTVGKTKYTAITSIAVVLFVLLGFINVWQLEMNLINNMPHVVSWLEGQTGIVLIRAYPSKTSVVTGIMSWLGLGMIISFSIRGCVGPRCQEKCCDCCGCTMAPDVKKQIVPRHNQYAVASNAV